MGWRFESLQVCRGLLSILAVWRALQVGVAGLAGLYRLTQIMDCLGLFSRSRQRYTKLEGAGINSGTAVADYEVRRLTSALSTCE